MSIDKTEMTFLFYANGHNELEPETWQSVVEIQKSNIGKQMNVVVQVSREEQPTIKLLRPDLEENRDDRWSGVRRYVFGGGRETTCFVMDNINMANPMCLCDFIQWGAANYPARSYVLSISGHIYQFVGLCPDYSGDKPLMMGFPEISTCIQMAFESQGANLDILILDTCYASTVEILYELGRHERPRIKNVLTYIGKGPLRGLDYAALISLLENTTSTTIEDVLCSLVSRILINKHLYGLIALRVNHEALELIKQMFCKLAATYLRCKQACAVELTPEELLSHYRQDYPWSLYLKPIHRLLESLIIAMRPAENDSKGVLPIHILYQKIPDEHRKNLYSRLSFSKQNDWAALLCDRPLEGLLSTQADAPEPAPIPITKSILTVLVASGNEALPPSEHKQQVEKVLQIKHWVLE